MTPCPEMLDRRLEGFHKSVFGLPAVRGHISGTYVREQKEHR